MTCDLCDEEDEIGERLRVIACDAKNLPTTDRSTLEAAANYIDWQNQQVRAMTVIVRELQEQREAQLERVRELQRKTPIVLNLFPAIVGSNCAAYYGYGVRQ